MKELDGVVETFYSNGQLESRETYKGDSLDGLCERWGRDGKLSSSATYKNGEVVEYIPNNTKIKVNIMTKVDKSTDTAQPSVSIFSECP